MCAWVYIQSVRRTKHAKTDAGFTTGDEGLPHRNSKDMRDYHIATAKTWEPKVGTPCYAFTFTDFARLTHFYAFVKELGMRPDGISGMTVYMRG